MSRRGKAGTGGLANPVVATMELGGAVGTSVMAILAPVLVMIVMGLVLVVFGPKLIRKLRAAAPNTPGGIANSQ